MAGLSLYNGAAVGPQTRYYAQRTGVAMGPATRAYRQGYRPASPAAPAGAVAPSGAAPAVRAGGASPGGWTPPPTGSYNPTRDVEVEEGGRGLGQLEGELGTAKTRDTADYFTQLGELGSQEGKENADYGTAKEALGRAFAQLGGKQTEQANSYGVLGGGALLQAAAKRASNQGLQQATADTAHGRNVEAINLARAKLAREGAPPDAANPLGGREFQDIGTKLTNAQSNQAFFAESQHRLAGQEAAERGYTPPPGPSGVRSSFTRTPGGSVAVDGATRSARLAKAALARKRR